MLAKHDLVDHRSDVYSLGATLYELLALRPAVDGKDRHEIIEQITHTDTTGLRHHDRDIPADLETIVLKRSPRSRKADTPQPRSWPTICAGLSKTSRSGRDGHR